MSSQIIMPDSARSGSSGLNLFQSGWLKLRVAAPKAVKVSDSPSMKERQ